MSSIRKRFRVAFSFAGGKRDFVEGVAEIIAQRFGAETILYDKFHEAEFARRDLGIYLPNLYFEQSDLIVVVLCGEYNEKQWTGLEWFAIHDLLSQRRDADVLLCRFDHAKVQGLPSTAGFVELDTKSPQELATLIFQRLAQKEKLPTDYYLRAKTDDPSALNQAPQGASVEPPPRDLVYISYRHRDKHWHRLLREILDADPDLKDRVWDDTDIHRGAFFLKEIDKHVARARVMIMLTSADYFGPDCGAKECEIEPALAAHGAGLLQILWIPVRRHKYRETPVSEIMAATGAGSIALEDLSPKEQMKALYRAHDEVRRCLDLPVKPRLQAPVITRLQLTMDRALAGFEEGVFREALEGLVGDAARLIEIVSAQEGIVTLGGDPGTLAAVVGHLNDRLDRFQIFARATSLQAFSWVAGGQTSTVPVSVQAPVVPAVETGEAPRRLVLLIHGIRTRAEWQTRIRALLEKHPGTTVENLGYGYFDAIRFLCPFFTREAAVRKITEKVRGALHHHGGKFEEVIVVGHSFASFLVGTMLRDNPTIIIDRLLLCGSVLRRDYRWDLLPNRPKKVLNEVGSRDIWPILAHSVTWGFDSSGTFGFLTFGVRDRFHAVKHSDYFKPGFAEKYWVPWILGGADVSSSYEAGARPPTPFLKNLLDVIHVKWVALFLIALIIWMPIAQPFSQPLRWSEINPVSPPPELANVRGIVSGVPSPLDRYPDLAEKLKIRRQGYTPQQQYVSFLSSPLKGKHLGKISLQLRSEYEKDLTIGCVVLRAAGGRLSEVTDLQLDPQFSNETVAALEGELRLLILLFPVSQQGDALLQLTNPAEKVLIQTKP